MDDVYKELIVPNGLVYPQCPDSLKAYSGLNKIRITWFAAKDPNVVKARVYWNNYTDSVDVIPTPGAEIISVDVDNLEENTYTFYVVTFDDEGNKSVPGEIMGEVLGDSYVMTLAARPVLSEVVAENYWKINWGTPALNEGAIGVEIEYQTTGGVKNTVTTPASESFTLISDAAPDTEYRYRTMYFVENKFMEPIHSDYTTRTVSTNFDEIKIPSDKFGNANLPGDFFTPYASAYPLENIWDNNISNIYASTIPTPYPNHFTIDLGGTVILTRFKLFVRTNYELYTGAGPRLFELWGTDNPPADGSFDNWHKLGEWEQPKPSGYGQGGSVGTITDADRAFLATGGNYLIDATGGSIQIKYLRVVINHCYASYGGNSNINLAIAEMEFYGGIFE
jgi:hypothetical protein